MVVFCPTKTKSSRVGEQKQKGCPMKRHVIVALCGLLGIGSVWSAQDPVKKEVTIYNKNVEGVEVDETFWRGGKDVGGSYNNHPIHAEEKKTFAFYNPEEKWDITLALGINDSVPYQVKLNVTTDGTLQYGDTITVENFEEHISVSNQTRKAAVLLNKVNSIVKIGTNPDNFPHDNNVLRQTLTVVNKNLFQVMLYCAALCKSSLPDHININTPFPVPFEKENVVRKNDTLLKQITYCLHQGKEQTLTTFSSEDTPEIIGNLIKLQIPQAAQENIEVRVNIGQIQSGDTLEIGTTEEDNKIVIVNQRTKELLAELFNNNVMQYVTLG